MVASICAVHVRVQLLLLFSPPLMGPRVDPGFHFWRVLWESDARVMARGKPVDASAAKVALRMLDVGMQRKTVAEL